MATKTNLRNSAYIAVGDVVNVKNGDHEGFVKDSTAEGAGNIIDRRIAELTKIARGGTIDFEGQDPEYGVETDEGTVKVPITIFSALFSRDKKG